MSGRSLILAPRLAGVLGRGPGARIVRAIGDRRRVRTLPRGRILVSSSGPAAPGRYGIHIQDGPARASFQRRPTESRPASMAGSTRGASRRSAQSRNRPGRGGPFHRPAAEQPYGCGRRRSSPRRADDERTDPSAPTAAPTRRLRPTEELQVGSQTVRRARLLDLGGLEPAFGAIRATKR